MSFIINPSRFSSGIGPASAAYAGFKTASFAASVSVPSVAFGTPASDRRVFVLVAIKPGSTYRSLVSATIAGVAATVHGQSADTTYKYNVALISAAVPAGATGTVVLNFSGSGSGGVYLGSYAAYGLQSATAVDLVTNSWTPSGVNPATSTLQVSAGGILFFAATAGSASQSFDTTGATKDFLQTIVSYSPQGQAFLGAHAAIAADDASYDVSVVGSAGVHYDHHLAASFR